MCIGTCPPISLTQAAVGPPGERGLKGEPGLPGYNGEKGDRGYPGDTVSE